MVEKINTNLLFGGSIAGKPLTEYNPNALLDKGFQVVRAFAFLLLS